MGQFGTLLFDFSSPQLWPGHTAALLGKRQTVGSTSPSSQRGFNRRRGRRRYSTGSQTACFNSAWLAQTFHFRSAIGAQDCSVDVPVVAARLAGADLLRSAIQDCGVVVKATDPSSGLNHRSSDRSANSTTPTGQARKPNAARRDSHACNSASPGASFRCTH
jgi:hypothetical protein